MPVDICTIIFIIINKWINNELKGTIMPKDDKNVESFVSAFLSKLDLATKSDVSRLMDRIDNLEQLIASVVEKTNKNNIKTSKTRTQNQSISDMVIDILKKSKTPLNYTQLKEKTGLQEKPLRNVIYRLNKLHKINTVKRGQYTINNEQEK